MGRGWGVDEDVQEREGVGGVGLIPAEVALTYAVIPAKAGIQDLNNKAAPWAAFHLSPSPLAGEGWGEG